MMRTIVPLLLFLLAGCGFEARQTLGPGIRSLGIEVFENDSMEPDVERALHAELTRAARRMIQADLVAPSLADRRLVGRLLDYHMRGGVRGRDNVLLESGVEVLVEARLVSREGKTLVGPLQLSQASGFRLSEGDGRTEAEERVLGNLAEGILLEVLVALAHDQAKAAPETLSGP